MHHESLQKRAWAQANQPNGHALPVNNASTIRAHRPCVPGHAACLSMNSAFIDSTLPAPVRTDPIALLFRMQKVDQLARHQRLLLLQGPNGPFFHHLAQRLRALGAQVAKVNFNAGDDLFFPPEQALCFRATAPDWPAFLQQVLRHQRTAAIVLFGQDRPLHRAAIDVARAMGLQVVVFEEGYLRPCWITMEHGGVNGDSALMGPLPSHTAPPATQPPHSPPTDFRHGFVAMALCSMAYWTWGSLWRSRYPHYQHHKPLTFGELWPWARGYLRKVLYGLGQRHLIGRLSRPGAPRFFLVPLQMAGDSQITHHSPWPSIEAFIDAVLTSFAAHAPADTHLVFKHHPMDVGHAHYGTHIHGLARRFGLGSRVGYIHGGHLPSLLTQARGVVVVNSTVGLQAMHHGTPVLALGRAIYDKPGLTSGGNLDRFWAHPQPPEPQTLGPFMNTLVQRSQVNASFYAPGGTWPRSFLSRQS